MSLLLVSLLFSVLNAPSGRILARASASQASADEPSARLVRIADQEPSQAQASPPPTKSGKQDKNHGKVETFTGTVEWEYETLYWTCDVPNCDHFALYDDATHTNYEIDDARAALPFEGKKVTITGTLDKKNHMIHLQSIQGLKP